MLLLECKLKPGNVSNVLMTSCKSNKENVELTPNVSKQSNKLTFLGNDKLFNSPGQSLFRPLYKSRKWVYLRSTLAGSGS